MGWEKERHFWSDALWGYKVSLLFLVPLGTSNLRWASILEPALLPAPSGGLGTLMRSHFWGSPGRSILTDDMNIMGPIAAVIGFHQSNTIGLHRAFPMHSSQVCEQMLDTFSFSTEEKGGHFLP